MNEENTPTCVHCQEEMFKVFYINHFAWRCFYCDQNKMGRLNERESNKNV